MKLKENKTKQNRTENDFSCKKQKQNRSSTKNSYFVNRKMIMMKSAPGDSGESEKGENIIIELQFLSFHFNK